MWVKDQHQRKNPTSKQKPGNTNLIYSNYIKQTSAFITNMITCLSSKANWSVFELEAIMVCFLWPLPTDNQTCFLFLKRSCCQQLCNLQHRSSSGPKSWEEMGWCGLDLSSWQWHKTLRNQNSQKRLNYQQTCISSSLTARRKSSSLLQFYACSISSLTVRGPPHSEVHQHCVISTGTYRQQKDDTQFPHFLHASLTLYCTWFINLEQQEKHTEGRILADILLWMTCWTFLLPLIPKRRLSCLSLSSSLLLLQWSPHSRMNFFF